MVIIGFLLTAAYLICWLIALFLALRAWLVSYLPAEDALPAVRDLASWRLTWGVLLVAPFGAAVGWLIGSMTRENQLPVTAAMVLCLLVVGFTTGKMVRVHQLYYNQYRAVQSQRRRFRVARPSL